MCCIQQAKHKCCRCIFKAMMVSYHPPHYRDEAAFQLCSSSRWAISLNPSCLPIASRWENIKVRREKKSPERVCSCIIVGKSSHTPTSYSCGGDFKIQDRLSVYDWSTRGISVQDGILQKHNSFDTSKMNLWHFHRN